VTGAPLSLRDPAGRLLRVKGRLLRVVHPGGAAHARACLESPTVARWQAERRFVTTRELPRGDWPELAGASAGPITTVLEHENVAFPSHPCEWAPAMLVAAGLLTLDLAGELLNEHRGLKDATPLNVLFIGNRPIFVDALSVEVRDPRSPIWLPYGQFIRTFLLPLIAGRKLAWSLRRTFTGARDGLTPEELFAALGWFGRLSPGVFGAVTGPVLLSRATAGRSFPAPPVTDERRATFVLRGLLARLRTALNSQAIAPRTSAWTGYRDPAVHAADYHAARFQLVESILSSHRPARVLDVGANDGAFSDLAAAAGAEVVSIDRDEGVVDRSFRRQEAAPVRVLPLVVDLADPTPATGWRNTERPSFLDRATGHFDCVLCMAVLHHLVVGDGLSPAAVVDLMATLTTDLLIAEFVPADDPWCARLAAGRPIPPERWSLVTFESEVARHFTIASRHPVGTGGRVVLVLRKRRAA
jgi:SAM-dependent methyltransferase